MKNYKLSRNSKKSLRIKRKSGRITCGITLTPPIPTPKPIPSPQESDQNGNEVKAQRMSSNHQSRIKRSVRYSKKRIKIVLRRRKDK